MSDSGGLTASSLSPRFDFNWVFLIELIVCGVLTIFFLFYFNRLFATLISYGIRAWTWHKYRVYIDIQALQISLLGGRVFFKGIRYHGNNETIFIQSGYVTWCYWLRNVREVDIRQSGVGSAKRMSSDSDEDHRSDSLRDSEQGGIEVAAKLPCRINAVLRGAEWFVYNRSAAYDAVVSSMIGSDRDPIPEVSASGHEKKAEKVNIRKRGTQKTSRTQENGFTQDVEKRSSASDTQEPEEDEDPLQDSSASTIEPSGGYGNNLTDPNDSFLLRLLPIHVECTKAAVVLGNEHTKSVFITKVDKASGEIDASQSRSIDQYRQMFNFHFEHPVVQMKPNEDFKEDQATTASRLNSGIGERNNTDKRHHHSHSLFQRFRRRAWHQLQDLVPYFRSSVDSLSSSVQEDNPDHNNDRGPAQWHGLSRYLEDDEQDDKAKWSEIEYATVSTIVDSPSASISFYWDVPGTVPAANGLLASVAAPESSDINGSLAPEWGIDLGFRDATINYGPWADRQRADIQKVFFPSLCQDAVPARKLLPGEARAPTIFKLHIEFDGETTLRVPIKEESKNWKWKGQADILGGAEKSARSLHSRSTRRKKTNKGKPGPDVRSFGWIDVTIASGASISYSMDMVAGPAGYTNKLDLDLPNIEITTSVNHGLLWRSTDQRISCDLSNPLQWNGMHKWQFDIISNGLELFILREHVFLMTDLVDDWASGPPSEYLTFSPFRYLLNLKLRDFRLYINVNDSNIINNPSDFDDNTFIILYGSQLQADACIPLELYRPHINTVSFDVKASKGGLNLHVPPWNTQATFLTSTEVAKLKELVISGKYQYCATTSSSNTDTLLLDVYGLGPYVQMYGFLIRYFLKIKDNYFGQDIHFRTLEEYQQLLRLITDDPTADVSGAPPNKKSNDLDVILSVAADEVNACLPANLYSNKNHVRIDIGSLGMDLRFTNYYMDLNVFFNTLSFSMAREDSGQMSPMSATSSTQLFVDGLKIYGHRIFGLPPVEPTYVCNWDLDVGTATGECSMEFLHAFVNSGKGIGFSFDDDENALPSISDTLLHDINFLRASVKPARIWIHVDEAALLVSTGSINVNFDDWAGSHYSRKLNMMIPDIVIACIDAESASRNRSRNRSSVETHAYVQTSVSIAMVSRKQGFSGERQLQQEHLFVHDQRTHRTEFLLHNYVLNDSTFVPPVGAVYPPAMCFPPMPECLNDGEIDDAVTLSSMSSIRQKPSHRLRKSSFLSISSSSHKSIRGGKQVEDYAQENSDLQSRLHSTSRSRSAPTQPKGSRSGQQRDPSASTGRQSSFHSAYGDHIDKPQLSSIAFSNSYLKPHFTLENVQPETMNVPEWSTIQENMSSSTEDEATLADIDPNNLDENTVHTSFIVELKPGVRGYFTPDAVRIVGSLLEGLQDVDPDDILDDLQVTSITSIFDHTKEKQSKQKMSELNLRIPSIHIRFISSFENKTGLKESNVDQYDICLKGLIVTTRSAYDASDISSPPKLKESSVLHLRLSSARLSAKERLSGIYDPYAAINGICEGIIFWMVSDDAINANASIRSVELATASGKVEYLAALLHRTTQVATSFADIFTTLSGGQQHRVRLFTYLVATADHHAPDPLFLTRPSYVLRSAPKHLRLSDSWKLVTRLRHMYSTLPSTNRNEIVLSCLNNDDICPENSQEEILGRFNQWRSWDLNNLANSLFIKKVFGTVDPIIEAEAGKSKPMKLIFDMGLGRFLVDPGPKQNEIALKRFTTTVSSESSVTITSTTSLPTRCTLVQVFCADIGVKLNWDLCELAENILRLQRQANSNSKLNQKKSISTKKFSNPGSHLVHVVLITDDGAVTLDTVNIRVKMLCKGLKLSFVLNDHTSNGLNISCTVAAQAATTQVRGRSEALMISQLQYPSIHLSHATKQQNGIQNNDWKFAGNCETLSFIIKQDTIAILDIIDLLIGDEVEQLHRMQQSLPKTEDPSLSNMSKAKNVVNNIHVALFLDKYHISIPLLQSVTYKISGMVARASLESLHNSEVRFDFDIKEHSHDIHTPVKGISTSISLLNMPPTNGRIAYQASSHENVISVFASTELVEIDAAAIHSLLTAVNRPEIVSVTTEIKKEFRVMQAHINEIFGTKTPETSTPKRKEASKPLVYDAHLTFAGLSVFANAHHHEQDTARLAFNLGSIQIEVCNRHEQQGRILPLPDVDIGLRQITFELSRWHKEGVESCGNFTFAAFLTATTRISDTGENIRSYHIKSDALDINVFAETASTVVDVLGHLQERIKDMDLSRERHYLRKLSKVAPRSAIDNAAILEDTASATPSSVFSLEMLNIQISWIVGVSRFGQKQTEDLVLSFQRVELSTKKQNSARLAIEDLQLQMVPKSQDRIRRSFNSALLPEIIFNVAYVTTHDARRFAFQAVGKSLDLRLTSQFIIPAADLESSIVSAAEKVRAATKSWNPVSSTNTSREAPTQSIFGSKRVESLLIDADFAGATVYLSGKKQGDPVPPSEGRPTRLTQPGRYGQFAQEETNVNTILRAPGLAWKVEYKDNGSDDPSLNAEVKVDASTNIIYPTVVPLILEISSAIKGIVGDDDKAEQKETQQPLKETDSQPSSGVLPTEEDSILTTDPSAILGRTRLNLGLRICKQEFGLSCQPIARVAATAKFREIYMTINTVRSSENGHFFTISTAFSELEASVQHVYSRESTGSFAVKSIVLSLMNSKHVNGISGLSAILSVSPMEVRVNAKQLQDFLLFREIWVPPELRVTSDAPTKISPPQTQTYLVQRYQQVAATGAFPWNATISIQELDVRLDLGQAIGKSAFKISNFWVSSKKTSDWEQNLCLGFEKIEVNSTGRMSGFVTLQDFKLRTSIEWPDREEAINQTPLIQASLGFSQLQTLASFDYQPFLVGDIRSFDFLMYNVRSGHGGHVDRLVAILEGDAVQVFCTTSSASQALALYQTFLRLVQEKRSNYETSLKEVERFMKRSTSARPSSPLPDLTSESQDKETMVGSQLLLQTDVVVTLKAVNIGAFPQTFYDQQVFKLEALNAKARFAVAMTDGQIHSVLGLTLGQLRIGLAGVRQPSMPKANGEISVEDVVGSATGSRGGTILKVPKLEATMQTWQVPSTNHIDYIFKSSFEGKVEVGWNYSRISFIRNMWAMHSRVLAQRLGKPLPPISAVKITGVPGEEDVSVKDGEQQKITAEVNVPQSKYDYTALEPPIIETPQLRDMGEATPPLEWIGLHRDRLPNLTHQIVIVTLLEVAKDVETAYSRILGSS